MLFGMGGRQHFPIANSATTAILWVVGVFVVGFFIAYHVVNQVAGEINITGELWVGNYGSGVYNLSGGTNTVQNWFVLGRYESGEAGPTSYPRSQSMIPKESGRVPG